MKSFARRTFAAALLCVALCLATAAQAAVIYVDADAVAGGNTGATWTDAYTDLQSALSAANSGDEIWVAEGLYRPTPGTDATVSFVLKDGVGLYGGFAGVETQRDERNWVANPTILDGDVDEDGTIAGNSQGLVRAIGVGASAVLDGFTVQYGAAVSAGGGLYIDGGGPTLRNLVLFRNQTTARGSSGGGLSSNNASLALVGVRFIENISAIGGGMYNNGGSLTLTDVVFEGNVANFQLAIDGGARGGGLRNQNAPMVLHDVDFIDNRAGYNGGLIDVNSGSSQQLVNVRFIGNDSTFGAAAVISAAGAELRNALFQGNRRSSSADGEGIGLRITSTADVILTNLSFTGNVARDTSGDVRPGSALLGDVSGAFVIDNALFWNNQNASGIGAPSASLASTGTTDPIIRSSLVQGCNPGGSWNTSCGIDGGGNLADTDPLLVDPPDPTAAPTEVGDSRLSPGSPAIDAGDNTRYPDLASATDLDGNARLFGAAIDLGPFESPFATLVVSVVGSGDVQAQPDQPSYELGESVELTAGAAAGWTFDGWSGAATGASNPVTVVLDTVSTDVTATFEKNPPIADAGPDQAVGVSVPATLDASASFDEDPAAVLSYAWTQTAGETVALDDPNAAQPAFVAPAQPDELQFAVVVSNDSGVFAVDVTEVTVAVAPYTIGGTVSGLKRPGLVLSLNDGASVLRFDVDNAYVFPPTFADGDTWTATILETPADHDCQLSRLDGTIEAASVTDLDVSCVTPIEFIDRFEALAPEPVIVND